MSYHYTHTTYSYYDETLTQTLLNQYINTLSSTSSIKTDQTYLWDIATMSAFTGSRHDPNPEVTSGESDEPRPSTVTSNIVNFTAAVNVDFDQARSAAIAAGIDASRFGNHITLADANTYATNITFADGGEADAYGNDTLLM